MVFSSSLNYKRGGKLEKNKLRGEEVPYRVKEKTGNPNKRGKCAELLPKRGKGTKLLSTEEEVKK